MHKSAAKKEYTVRNGFLISLVSVTFTAGVAFAQDDPPPAKAPAKAPPLVELKTQKQDLPAEAGPAPKSDFDLNAAPLMSEGGWAGGCDSPDCGCGSRCWASLDYLLWWIKDGPVPGPLVTTGNPNVDGDLAGALGQSTTKVLFGGSNLDYGRFAGLRLTIGGWITPCQSCGIEVSAFALEERSVRFAARSDANGNPPLYVPAFNPVKNIENRLVVSEPFFNNNQSGGFAGGLVWASTTRLWGDEINGVFGSWSSCNWQGSFLAGYRYLDLNESLSLLNATVTLPIPESETSAFTSTIADRFQTRNQFYGGQIGAKASYCWDFLSLDFVGKLALGDSHQVVNIMGISTQTATGPTPGTFPGGFFAQPTNIGRQARDEFTVVPEFEIKVGCCICPGVRAFVGYDILYWNQVVRPGSQIDRNLNLSQSPVISQNLPQALVGTAQPVPLFNRSDFYANGVTFGLELRY
jgi:Putative beta barrel porin-7 (BBP7)